jgi:hypothetical protein
MAKAARSLPELPTDLVAWGHSVDRIVARTSADTIGDDDAIEHALARVVEAFGETAGRLLRDFPEWSSSGNGSDPIYAYRLRNNLAHGTTTCVRMFCAGSRPQTCGD